MDSGSWFRGARHAWLLLISSALIGSTVRGFLPLRISSRQTSWRRSDIPTAIASTAFLKERYIFEQHFLNLSRRPSLSSSSRQMVSAVVLSMVAKSGGKLISSSEQYSKMVLSPNAPKPVMVFFTAPWCGPCRLSIPVVQSITKQFANQLEVVEVCTDDLADVAADSGVVSIPTIQFYHRGELLDTIVGCVARNVLAAAVEKVLDDIALDPKRLKNNQTATVLRDDGVDGE